MAAMGPNATERLAVPGNPAAGKTLRASGDPFGSMAAARAAFLEALKDVDVVVDETYAWEPAAYNYDSFLAAFGLSGSEDAKFLRSRAVLRVDGTVSESNGLDWYESRIALPHLAVDGLAKALGDTELQGRYFRHLGRNQTP